MTEELEALRKRVVELERRLKIAEMAVSELIRIAPYNVAQDIIDMVEESQPTDTTQENE